MSHASLFIDGTWIKGQGFPLNSVNPATNELVYSGNSASNEQVDAAFIAARQAFATWMLTEFEERLSVVETFAELLKTNKDDLSVTIAKETGKPLWEAVTEINAMIGKIAISKTAYLERTGTKMTEMPTGHAVLRHRPHGVVAVFGPYNFPGHLPNGHIVPALLAGNTIVFKPSDLTPLVAHKTVELWQQAGLPKGVLNLLQGEVETGKAIAKHVELDGLFFTGSSTTGKLLHQQFAGYPGKILALEMGGNNSLIVGQVKDERAAVHDIVQSAFITSGQRCTCARKLLLPKTEQGDRILSQLIDAAKQLKPEIYNHQPPVFLGSMISAEAAQKVLATQQAYAGHGAEVLLPMKLTKVDTGLISPGIIDVTKAYADIPDEECFGPLLQIYRYSELEEAVQVANDTSFGLSAGLLSDIKNDYDYFLPRIRAGIVNWNRPLTGASSAAPFGGIGDSGNHRASAYYAADYCSYPVASLENDNLVLPETLSPGLIIK